MSAIKGTLLAVVVSVVGCGGNDTPVSPPPLPACQVNHTSLVSFRNNGSRTVDIIWDGGVLGVLTAGETGLAITVAANATHMFDSRITNTNLFPCLRLSPVPVECSMPTYGTCSGF